MTCRICKRPQVEFGCAIADRNQNPHPQCPLFLSITDMIEELDSLPDMSDGIDPRTYREVYDAGILNDADIRRSFRVHCM